MIVESHPARRAQLAGQLIEMGLRPSDIHCCGSYSEAKGMIPKVRPRLLIVEFGTEQQCGVELIRKQRLFDVPGRESTGVVLTDSLAETSWAKERGENVDLILTRPIPPSDFKTLLLKMVLGKLKAGKMTARVSPLVQVAQKSVTEAVRKFDLARTLSYGIEEDARTRLRILGLFDKLRVSGRETEAYELARKGLAHMREFAERLDQIIRLAVKTGQFAHIAEYYDLFTQTPLRSEPLTRAMYAALLVGGKHFIARGEYARGSDYFRKAAVSSGGETRVLREAILRLAEVGLTAEALGLLGRFPVAGRNSPEYLALEYAIQERMLDPIVVIGQGWSLVKRGARDPLIYEILIRSLAGRGKLDPAENLALDAERLWPEHRGRFRLAMGVNAVD